MSKNSNRVGFYCWAGPGTIAMLRLKYFNPPINESSFLTSYDQDYLWEVKKTFGVTDFFAMYSWGFSDEFESADREFILSRLANFKKLGLRVHAYIQGPNLVYRDFKDRDFFCIDNRGRKISYHRGRKLTCPNNPNFRKYIYQKIEQACEHDFAGIYMDNAFFGQLGLPSLARSPKVFVGCACKYCRGKFEKQTDRKFPKDFRDRELTQQYLDFRADSLTEFLAEAAAIAHRAGKEFGSNSYDPRFDSKFVYGQDLSALDKIQDYFLFETISLPSQPDKKNHLYLDELRQTGTIAKPVFVLTYKKGISFDSSFRQKDFDSIFTEAEQLDYAPCLKGTEFVTRGRWHNLEIERYRSPRILSNFELKKICRSKFFCFKNFSFLTPVLDWLANPFMTFYFENRLARKIFGWLEQQMLD